MTHGSLPVYGATKYNRRFMRLLYDPVEKTYVHVSGGWPTANRIFAWVGTPEQAETLKQRWLDNGEEWPFETIKLEDKET